MSDSGQGEDRWPRQRGYRRRGEDARRRCLCLRLSENEHEAIRAAAERNGMTRTFFAAEAVLLAAREEIPLARSADRALLREVMESNRQVRRVGSNLNQITMRFHTSEECPPELGRCLERVAAGLAQLEALAVRLDEVIDHR
ncbi:plasmid mobilization protein [Actinocorallia aurantiaca]